MAKLASRLAALEAISRHDRPAPTADLMYRAFVDLYMDHSGPPHSGESFADYLDSNLLASMLAVVRCGGAW